MSKPKNNVSDLLAAIQRKTPDASPNPQPSDDLTAKPAAEREDTPKKRPQPAAAPKKIAKGKVGKAVQFWMHDADTQLVRELSAWLAGQGVRPSDSMVIRAALRFAETGAKFLESYWEAAKLDGRLKRD